LFCIYGKRLGEKKVDLQNRKLLSYWTKHTTVKHATSKGSYSIIKTQL